MSEVVSKSIRKTKQPLLIVSSTLEACLDNLRRGSKFLNSEDPFGGCLPYLVTKQRLALSCEALGDPISTHTFGTPTQRPVFPILKYTAFVGTRFWKVKNTRITWGTAHPDLRADCMGVWPVQSHRALWLGVKTLQCPYGVLFLFVCFLKGVGR